MMLPGRRGRPAGVRSGMTGNGLLRSPRLNREPGDLPYVPGEEPKLGAMPDASTEVVMAKRWNFLALGRVVLRLWPLRSAVGPVVDKLVGLIPPSVLPDISPTRREITRGAGFAPHRRFDLLQGQLFGETFTPSRSPSLWGRCPAGQRGASSRRHRQIDRAPSHPQAAAA
jgi:hypothetical protein